jgi:hypothetical protein
MNEHSQSIDIDASPEEAFRSVSDLPAMGQYSPENTGGEWINASGPALGVKFKGSNAHGRHSWTTTATIVAFTPPSAFAFEITVGPAKVSRWSYDIESTPTGCRVSESWIDRRGAIARWAAKRSMGKIDRAEFTVQSIRETLENLKSHLERA